MAYLYDQMYYIISHSNRRSHYVLSCWPKNGYLIYVWVGDVSIHVAEVRRTGKGREIHNYKNWQTSIPACLFDVSQFDGRDFK